MNEGQPIPIEDVNAEMLIPGAIFGLDSLKDVDKFIQRLVVCIPEPPFKDRLDVERSLKLPRRWYSTYDHTTFERIKSNLPSNFCGRLGKAEVQIQKLPSSLPRFLNLKSRVDKRTGLPKEIYDPTQIYRFVVNAEMVSSGKGAWAVHRTDCYLLLGGELRGDHEYFPRDPQDYHYVVTPVLVCRNISDRAYKQALEDMARDIHLQTISSFQVVSGGLPSLGKR